MEYKPLALWIFILSILLSYVNDYIEQPLSIFMTVQIIALMFVWVAMLEFFCAHAVGFSNASA
jgi:hypothetical protein